MSQDILENESNVELRRVYFQIVGLNGISPIDKAGFQPQITFSYDPGWTDTGIGPLVVIGHGRHYAELDQSSCAPSGTIIETRFKDVDTAECPGDTIHIVAFNHNIAPTNVLPILTHLIPTEFTVLDQSVKNIILAQYSANILTFKTEGYVISNPADISLVIHREDGTVVTRLTGGLVNFNINMVCAPPFTETVDKYHYKLWDTNNQTLLASGTLEIKLAPI